MPKRKMHADEIDTDIMLVQRLLAAQFPEWADLAIVPVESYGTDHDIYRLGDELVARLPRIGWATDQAEKEARWLPRFAPHLPLAVPVQVARGEPAEAYPFEWSVYEWLPGASGRDAIDDLDRVAEDLAAFVHALRGLDTTGAHPRGPSGRGAPLAELDEDVRSSIVKLGDRVDGSATLRLWEESLNAPVWDGPEVWVHGDLLPGNLLATDGRLSAVIDWGGLNVGDPACDPAARLERVRGSQSPALSRRTTGRRSIAVTRPRLDDLPGSGGAAVLLGNQSRDGRSDFTRASPGSRRPRASRPRVVQWRLVTQCPGDRENDLILERDKSHGGNWDKKSRRHGIR